MGVSNTNKELSKQLIDCGVVVTPEPCPQPVNICIEGCEDAVVFDAGELDLSSLGRVLQVDVTLRHV